MSNIKKLVLKSASENISFRRVLIAELIKEAKPTYEDYVARMKKEKKTPLGKEDWEKRILGLGEDPKRKERDQKTKAQEKKDLKTYTDKDLAFDKRLKTPGAW
jgi:hypothetical protein